ncbi:TVP38/TMEM64 family protein [Metabacillus indicus]|uniref:TVP38/TMEM64 family protein n=1 Tax=Metabacillus indicus TaxID=246786 RepID=UPI003CF1CE89
MKSKTKIQIVSILVFIGILIYMNQRYINLSPQTLKHIILSIGIFAPLIYVLFYSVRPFILFPASVLTLAGGLAFGPFYGTLLTITGASIGAWLAFMFTRKFGADKIRSKWGSKIISLENVIQKNGFFIILLLRLIPLFHFDLISYAAGLSKMKTSHFLAGTFLGMLPGTFAYSFLGASTVSENKSLMIIAILFFSLITILPLVFKNRIKRYISAKEEK